MREAADRVVGRLSSLIAPPSTTSTTISSTSHETAESKTLKAQTVDEEEHDDAVENEVHDSPRPPGFTHFSFGALAIEG